MREIPVTELEKNIKKLFLDLQVRVDSRLRQRMEAALTLETEELPRMVLNTLLKNQDIAAAEGTAICQDTGMAVVFVRLGQDVHFTGGSVTEAIQNGVWTAYDEGYFRKSVVADPLFDRVNTRDNTPAVIHWEVTEGDQVEIYAMAKGFGSENMSAVKMLKPSDGVEGVKDFVIDTVQKAGPNPCPPLVVGVGIGGTLEKAALLSKEALLRPLGDGHKEEKYRQLEEELLTAINALSIGPGGFGGRTTAFAVQVEHFPTHIAGLPCAVTVCCHAMRHGHVVL